LIFLWFIWNLNVSSLNLSWNQIQTLKLPLSLSLFPKTQPVDQADFSFLFDPAGPARAPFLAQLNHTTPPPLPLYLCLLGPARQGTFLHQPRLVTRASLASPVSPQQRTRGGGGRTAQPARTPSRRAHPWPTPGGNLRGKRPLCPCR
jgi:hypothetical protein